MTDRDVMRHGIHAAIRVVAVCIALPVSAATLSVRVSNTAGKAVTDAVAYALPRAGTKTPAVTPRPVAIEQMDREFVPFVTPIQTGTLVNFPNRDPLLHHVYSFSPVKSFEIKLYSGEAPQGILFDKAGTVTLGCNIHDWMLGYLHIVDTPYFAKTGADGLARIAEIVAGEFDVHLWHPLQRTAAAPQPIRLDTRSSAELAFTLDTAPRKKKFKPPLDTVRYK